MIDFIGTSTRILFGAILAIALALSAGCASAPSVREAKVHSTEFGKAHYMILAYHDLPMRVTSSSCADCAESNTRPNELTEFGAVLIKEGKAVFAQHNVRLLAAHINDGTNLGKHPIPLKPSGGFPPLLIIAPTSGTTLTTTETRLGSFESRTTKKVDYLFSIQLLDVRTRQLLWTAKIDTAAWDTADAKPGYDSAYVTRFLNTLLEQLAKDAMI